MNNNDTLRSLRYTFDFSDDQMMAMFELGGRPVTRAEVSEWLKKDEDPAFKPIYDKDLAQFLNGLIVKNRGKKDDKPPVVEKSLSNNGVLRKIRIALSLQDEDMLEIVSKAGQHLSKHELSAFSETPPSPNTAPAKIRC